MGGRPAITRHLTRPASPHCSCHPATSPCINSPDDTIEHINPDLLGYAAEIGIAMLDSLAEEVR